MNQYFTIFVCIRNKIIQSRTLVLPVALIPWSHLMAYIFRLYGELEVVNWPVFILISIAAVTAYKVSPVITTFSIFLPCNFILHKRFDVLTDKKKIKFI